MIVLAMVLVLVVAASLALVRLVGLDGLGSRPGPRSRHDDDPRPTAPGRLTL